MSSDEDATRGRRLGRFAGLDKRPVNLDGFAQRDDEAGLVAFASANDPEPSVALDPRGRRLRPHRRLHRRARPRR